MITETKEKQKLWTNQYILMMLVSLMIATTNIMLGATLPMYALHIGGSNSSAGLIMTIFAITALLFRPVSGHVSDNRSRKIVLVGGTIISILVLLAYHAADGIILLLAFRCLHGIGFSAQSTASGTIVADIVPPSRLSEGIGYYGISNTIAMALGPGIGLFLMKSYGYQMIFTVALAMGIISLISVMFVNYEKKGIKDNSEVKEDEIEKLCTENGTVDACPKRGGMSIAFEKSALAPSAVIFFLSVGSGSIITFIPAFGISRGIENIGLFFTVYACALLVSRMTSGKAADRYGDFVVLMPAFGVLVISFILIAFASTLTLVLIGGVLFGLGSGITQPVMNALTIKRSPVDRRGAANATLFSAIDIGMALGAGLWGMVSEFTGFTYVYLGSALSIAVASAAYIFLLHRDVKI